MGDWITDSSTPVMMAGDAVVTGKSAWHTAKARTAVRAKRPSPSAASRRRNLRKTVKLCMRRLSELKHSTTNVSAATLVAGAVTSASILSQGTTASTRVGQQVHVSRFYVTGVCTLPAASASDCVRLLFYVDKQADGANPTVTDLLETASFYAPYNMDKVGSRFRILSDRMIDLEAQAATVTTVTRSFTIKTPLDFITYYQSNAGTISDVLKNGIGVIVISQAALASVAFNMQVCYTDL